MSRDGSRLRVGLAASARADELLEANDERAALEPAGEAREQALERRRGRAHVGVAEDRQLDPRALVGSRAVDEVERMVAAPADVVRERDGDVARVADDEERLHAVAPSSAG